MTTAERVFALWKAYGWNVEEPPAPASVERWCHGFEGPPPAEPEPDIRAERGDER